MSLCQFFPVSIPVYIFFLPVVSSQAVKVTPTVCDKDEQKVNLWDAVVVTAAGVTPCSPLEGDTSKDSLSVL